MTTTNDWIRMSERRPTEEDLPIWLVDPLCDGRGGNRAMPVQIWMTTLPSLDCFTHWRSAQSDIPAPPKEPTQRERDEAKFKKFCETDLHFTPCGASWHAALAWERAEIAKLLAEYNTNYPTEHWMHFAEQLRARLRP